MAESSSKKVGKCAALGEKLVYAALTTLRDNGGNMPAREVLARVEKQVPLDDWARARYEKTGYVRWQSVLHFYSIDLIKAGYLIKKKGTWYLTPEGEEVLKRGEAGLFRAASEGYRKWKAENPREGGAPNGEVEIIEPPQDVAIDQIEQQGMDTLRQHIQNKSPYEFQDLVAALLRGMGYFTPFVAPRGKDGGVDIIAYRDPLGTVTPRIKAQVKHRQDSARVEEIRQLMGLLSKDGDVGMFISTGGFTSDALSVARSSHVHVELIDLNRFIELWLDFYGKMTDEDKRQLPLRPIYFLAPIE